MSRVDRYHPDLMKMVEAFRDECHCERDRTFKELTTVKKVKRRAAKGSRKIDAMMEARK